MSRSEGVTADRSVEARAREAAKSIDAEGHFELQARLDTPYQQLPECYANLRELHFEAMEMAYLAGHAAATAEAKERIAELEAMVAKLRGAYEEARDNVLYERGPLEGSTILSDEVNAVLGILDDAFVSLMPDEFADLEAVDEFPSLPAAPGENGGEG
jgi:hypothetical protein